MQQTTPQFEQTLLKIGSIAFLAGIAISIISTVFHADGDPTNNIRVFAEYANSPPWIAVHIGQFVGGIVVFAGGFVALFRLLMKPESMIASLLVWIGFATAIIAASALSILQAVDGIALKRAVDSWAVAAPGEKIMAFRVAEGIRWTEIGTNSIYHILQGTVAVVFGVAITLSTLLSRWIGAVGIFAGVITIAAGVEVAYVGFASSESLIGLYTISLISYSIWVAILGIFMWRKRMILYHSARQMSK